MTRATSVIMERLSSCEGIEHERYEISDPNVHQIRVGGRALLGILHESQNEAPDTQRLINMLRVLVFEPAQFTPDFFDVLLTDSNFFSERLRFGAAFDETLQAMRCSAVEAIRTGSRLCEIFGEVLREINEAKLKFRVYCHRRAKHHFESVFASRGLTMPDDAFLHSLIDYREVEAFDALLKVGPLRSRGWGAVPDAIATAPRYNTFFQFVWAGCPDHTDFGYDPVSAVQPQTDRRAAPLRTRIRSVGAAFTAGPEIQIDDDLEFTVQSHSACPVRKAVLLGLADGTVVPFPLNSEIPSLDYDAETDPARFRLANDDLRPGMFLVTPSIDRADLGGSHTARGIYSAVWKRELVMRFHLERRSLIQDLRRAGLDHVHLEGAIRHWCETSANVITAPQQMSHFEKLIKCLGISYETNTHVRRRPGEWWQHAWAEIRNSRGRAIIDGMHEQELVYDQLFSLLARMLPVLRASRNSQQSVEIPKGYGIEGTVALDEIAFVEDGYLVPEEELRYFTDWEAAQVWRG